jgi:hypothetical protein
MHVLLDLVSHISQDPLRRPVESADGDDRHDGAGDHTGTRDGDCPRWATERAPNVPGFKDQWVMFADDGRTVVLPVRFTSKEDYLRMAEDRDQHA